MPTATATAAVATTTTTTTTVTTTTTKATTTIATTTTTTTTPPATTHICPTAGQLLDPGEETEALQFEGVHSLTERERAYDAELFLVVSFCRLLHSVAQRTVEPSVQAQGGSDLVVFRGAVGISG